MQAESDRNAGVHRAAGACPPRRGHRARWASAVREGVANQLRASGFFV
jgi:hypothetical protein